MLRVDEMTQKQLDAVRRKCQELDFEHPGVELEKKFEEALDYAARFGDQDLVGKSLNYLKPLDKVWMEGDTLDIWHFNFGVQAKREDAEGNLRDWYFLAMHYHSGGQDPIGSSVELCPKPYPHWSFHS